MALRAEGWTVTARDRDPEREAAAVGAGAADATGWDASAEVSFVATPVSSIPEVVSEALSRTSGLVTDVGSVKGPVVNAVADGRFVGGHPMAGSEQDGLDGARADLFAGATWVLTPSDNSDAAAFARVRGIVASLGAEVVDLEPARHDELVAVVSHVPHLTAATLMVLADEGAESHRAMLRLAAGGFRDMTRIAAGHPGIWPDICAENSEAIVATLDRLIAGLAKVRGVVADGASEELLAQLDRARRARINLPVSAGPVEALSELRVPLADEPGQLAAVVTLAAELGVNIADIEIAHSAEGAEGVLLLVVATEAADLLRGGLMARGFRPSARALE